MRRSRKWNATLETAQRGRAAQARQRAASREVKHLHGCERCLTSPAAPITEGSDPFVRSARRPLLEGGDKNPPQLRFISNHQRWATNIPKKTVPSEILFVSLQLMGTTFRYKICLFFASFADPARIIQCAAN